MDQFVRLDPSSHDLILCEVSDFCLHSITGTTRDLVLDKAQAERTASVLVAREFFNSGIGILGRVKSNNTSTTGSAIRLVLDLSLFDLANGSEQLDKIFVASGPWKLDFTLICKMMRGAK